MDTEILLPGVPLLLTPEQYRNVSGDGRPPGAEVTQLADFQVGEDGRGPVFRVLGRTRGDRGPVLRAVCITEGIMDVPDWFRAHYADEGDVPSRRVRVSEGMRVEFLVDTRAGQFDDQTYGLYLSAG